LEQASPKFIIKTLSKFEKFIPTFTTFFKNNKLLIPSWEQSVSIVTRLVVLRTLSLEQKKGILVLAGSVTPNFYNIRVSIMHKKIRGKLNKSVGPVAFFQGIVAFFQGIVAFSRE
jgi:hypothetical protein